MNSLQQAQEINRGMVRGVSISRYTRGSFCLLTGLSTLIPTSHSQGFQDTCIANLTDQKGQVVYRWQSEPNEILVIGTASCSKMCGREFMMGMQLRVLTKEGYHTECKGINPKRWRFQPDFNYINFPCP